MTDVIDLARLATTLQVFADLTLRIVILFVPITLGIVLLQRWLGDDRLGRLMGGERLLPALLKGVGLGAITPFCGCSTVPLLLGLLRARVRFGAVAAFMLASPLLNPYIVGVVGVLFGARLLAGYVALAVITSLVLGWLWERAGLEAHLQPHVLAPVAPLPVPAPIGRSSTLPDLELPVLTVPDVAPPPPAVEPWRGLRRELAAARGPVVAQLRPMVRPVLIGLAIGAFLYGFVPRDLVAGLLGETEWWTLPVAALLGMPLYLRGEAAFPIGAGLLAAGVGLGPMLAMVIGGMGASIPEVTILSGIFTRRLLAVFLASVFVTALLGGLLLPPLA